MSSTSSSPARTAHSVNRERCRDQRPVMGRLLLNRESSWFESKLTFRGVRCARLDVRVGVGKHEDVFARRSENGEEPKSSHSHNLSRTVCGLMCRPDAIEEEPVREVARFQDRLLRVRLTTMGERGGWRPVRRGACPCATVPVRCDGPASNWLKTRTERAAQPLLTSCDHELVFEGCPRISGVAGHRRLRAYRT